MENDSPNNLENPTSPLSISTEPVTSTQEYIRSLLKTPAVEQSGFNFQQREISREEPIIKQEPASTLPQIPSGSPPSRQTSHSRNNSQLPLSPTRPSSNLPPPTPTLLATVHDLRTLLKSFLNLLPASLRRLRFLLPSPIFRIARAVIERIAMTLHKRGALASNMLFDILTVFWTAMIHVFFREIRTRGAWRIPKEGAVIFVVGPHHNQFLDPIVLLAEVRREAGRRISFLVAEKSMQRKFIGISARSMQAIPVVRAQDMASSGTGTLTVSPEDALLVLGYDTKFMTDFKPKRQIMLSKAFGNASAEIVEVLDDNSLRIKKEFSKKAMDGMKTKESGVPFKVLPYIDQTEMYSSVYQKLKDGGCIGIFPEGGSHDRTDLLPLKAGVSIMALGALSANPSLRLRIVPVGMSYFHPHKFRSRAVVEFGSPIEIPSDFVEGFEKGGDEKKKAIGGIMDLVVNGLKSVTIRAPDYETLMLIQATRRLYRPPGQHLTLGQIVELNKRFIAGYEVYKEEPVLKELSQRVREYNKILRYMGLKDHQIERVGRPLWRSILLLCYRTGLLAVWGSLALPGVILNSPIFVAASYISHMKAREALAASTVKIKGNDVLATWKVLVALAGAPALYSIYAGGAVVLAHKFDLPLKYKLWAPVATMAGLPLIAYSALKFGEVGMDVYKSLRPLFLSIVPGNEKSLDKIRVMRSVLQVDIDKIVNELGPKLFEDFQQSRIVPAAVPLSPNLTRRRSTYGQGGQGSFLTHPFSWLDDLIFGWGMTNSEEEKSVDDEDEFAGSKSGYTTHDEGDRTDYDEVINILQRELGQDQPISNGNEPGDRTPRYRSSSRSRSKSQLDLTSLDDKINSKPIRRRGEASGASSPVLAMESPGLCASRELGVEEKKKEE